MHTLIENTLRVKFYPPNPFHHNLSVVAAIYEVSGDPGRVEHGRIYFDGSCSCGEHKSNGGECIHLAAYGAWGADMAELFDLDATLADASHRGGF